MRRLSWLTIFLAVFVLVQFGFVWSLLHVDRSTRDRGNGVAAASASPCSSSSPATCSPCATVSLAQAKELFSMTIIVFTFNRIGGLRTLMKSLIAADYLGRKDVRLHVFLDYPKKSDMQLDGTREYLDALEWPHGPYEVHRRLANAGLKRTIMESWYPTRNDEVAAFFEDDIEVSFEWFRWVTGGMDAYFKSTNEIDRKLLGLSLYRPIKDELSGRDVRKPTKDGSPFALQQPCSWGAVFFPRPWREFRQWYDAHRGEPVELLDPADQSIRPTSNSWDSGSSWKKYLIKLMYQKGWYMVYPNFGGAAVLSTNHLLQGVHPTPPKDLFELPLVVPIASMSEDDQRILTLFPPLETLVAYDVMFKHVGAIRELHGYLA
jgi:hypothetical protein